MAKVVSFKIEIEGTQQQAVRLNEIDAKLSQINATRKQNLKILSQSKGQNKELTNALAKQTTEIIGLKQEKSKLTQGIKLENNSLKKLGSAYDKLVADTRQAKNAAKELGARYGLTSKEFLKASKSAGVLDKRLKKLDNAVGDNFRNVGNYEKGLRKAGAGLAKIGVGIGVAVAAFSRITRAVGASIEAFGEQERTEKALEVALGFTSKALLDQAAALQKTTKFGDESIIQSQAFLAQFGLQEDQIKKLTPAILDFAEAQGVSLEDASKLLSKSLGSSTNALSRYGIEITGAVGSNERLESAITSLNDKFAGQASAAAQVGTGPLTQLKNVFGDLQEVIGGLIVNAIGPAINKLGQWTSAVSDFLTPAHEQSDALQEQRAELNVLVQQIIRTNDNEEKRGELIEKLNVKYPTLLKNIDRETLSNAELVKILKQANKEYDQRIKRTVFEEDIAEQAKESALAYRDLADSETAVSETLVTLTEDFARFNKNTEDGSKKQKVYNDALAALNDDSLSYFEVVEAINKAYAKQGFSLSSLSAQNDFLAGSVLKLNTLDNERIENQKTYDEEVEKGIKLQEEMNEVISDVTDTTNDENDAIEEQIGLIEAQAKVVADLQKKKVKADKEGGIASLNQQLEIEEKELERLRNLKIRVKDVIVEIDPIITFDELTLSPEEKKKAEDELNKKLTTEVQVSAKAQLDLELSEKSVNKTQDDIKAAQQLLKDAAIQAAQDLSDSLFEQGDENRQRELERDLQDLELKKNNELTAIQDGADIENEILKSKLQKGLITEQQFADQKAIADQNRRNQELKANEKAIAEQRKLEKQAFEEKKKQDIAQALINGALAVTSILASSPDPLKPIGPLFAAQVAIAAATTGLQIATIASQKFAKGGVVEGASHENGGVSFNGGAYELEGGETIINKRSSAMFRNELSAMNQAGGGIKFANGGVITPVASEPSNQLNVAALAEDVANTIRVENVATETASVNNEVVDVENVASA